jgi:hypothetical protein
MTSLVLILLKTLVLVYRNKFTLIRQSQVLGWRAAFQFFYHALASQPLPRDVFADFAQQQFSAQRFEHTVKVEQESDIDGQLLGWLKAAYNLSK